VEGVGVVELDAEDVGVGVDRTADTGRNSRKDVGEAALAKGVRKPAKDGTGRNADCGEVPDSAMGDGPRRLGTNTLGFALSVTVVSLTG
jgi:hypothetical protein